MRHEKIKDEDEYLFVVKTIEKVNSSEQAKITNKEKHFLGRKR